MTNNAELQIPPPNRTRMRRKVRMLAVSPASPPPSAGGHAAAPWRRAADDEPPAAAEEARAGRSVHDARAMATGVLMTMVDDWSSEMESGDQLGRSSLRNIGAKNMITSDGSRGCTVTREREGDATSVCMWGR